MRAALLVLVLFLLSQAPAEAFSLGRLAHYVIKVPFSATKAAIDSLNEAYEVFRWEFPYRLHGGGDGKG